MILKKRGQITVFIIIGIILLFSSALVFYIKGQISTIQQPVFEQVIEDAPLESDVFNTFVKDCLESVAVEQISIIGIQGGFANYKSAGLDYNINNPERSDLLRMAPNSNVYVPFWQSMAARDKCETDCYFKQSVPPLKGSSNSIEAGLETMIQENIQGCFDDFRSFKERGFTITENSPPKVDVVIASKDVYVDMDYDVTVKKAEQSSHYDSFAVTIPLNLNKIYALARDVFNITTSASVLESLTMDMIATAAGPSEDALPPIYDFELGSGGSTIWQQSEVKKHLQQILMAHVPMVQYIGTRNYYRRSIENPTLEAIIDNMIVDINKTYPWYNVELVYLAWWPTYVHVSPSDGEIIKPDTIMGMPVSNLISGLGFQEYKFFYDVTYPVLVKIDYPEAFNGEGFTFMYAIEPSLRNNRFNNVTAAASATAGDTFVCRKELWDTGNYTIKLHDLASDTYVEGARVSMTFGDEGCYLGDTSYEFGNEPALVTKLPIGIGSLAVEADGYGSQYQLIPVAPNSSDEITLEVYPEKEVTLKMKKVAYKKLLVGEDEIMVYDPTDINDLSSTDRAMFDYAQLEAPDPLTGTSIVEADSSRKIKLVPGKYSINIKLMSGKPLIIPEDHREDGGFLGIGKVKYTIQEINMAEVPYGETQWDNITLSWEVTPEDLYGHETVEFAVPYVDYYSFPPGFLKVEDLELLKDVTSISMSNRTLLEPEWS